MNDALENYAALLHGGHVEPKGSARWVASGQFYVLAAHPDGWRAARLLGTQYVDGPKTGSPGIPVAHSVLFSEAAVSTQLEISAVVAGKDGVPVQFADLDRAEFAAHVVERARAAEEAQRAETERVRTMFDNDTAGQH